jgi:hypothetical protein
VDVIYTCCAAEDTFVELPSAPFATPLQTSGLAFAHSGAKRNFHINAWDESPLEAVTTGKQSARRPGFLPDGFILQRGGQWAGEVTRFGLTLELVPFAAPSRSFYTEDQQPDKPR